MPKIVIKVLLISIIILTLFFAAIRVVRFKIEQSVSRLEDQNIGLIELPNNYAVEKISVNNRIITHSDKGIVVKKDVTEIGWNERYVLYKRVFIDSNIEEVEIGIIDTESGEIQYLDEDEIESKLLELNITDEISLKNVAMFFPETRGFYNNN